MTPANVTAAQESARDDEDARHSVDTGLDGAARATRGEAVQLDRGDA